MIALKNETQDLEFDALRISNQTLNKKEEDCRHQFKTRDAVLEELEYLREQVNPVMVGIATLAALVSDKTRSAQIKNIDAIEVTGKIVVDGLKNLTDDVLTKTTQQGSSSFAAADLVSAADLNMHAATSEHNIRVKSELLKIKEETEHQYTRRPSTSQMEEDRHNLANTLHHLPCYHPLMKQTRHKTGLAVMEAQVHTLITSPRSGYGITNLDIGSVDVRGYLVNGKALAHELALALDEPPEAAGISTHDNSLTLPADDGNRNERKSNNNSPVSPHSSPMNKNRGNLTKSRHHGSQYTKKGRKGSSSGCGGADDSRAFMRRQSNEFGRHHHRRRSVDPTKEEDDAVSMNRSMVKSRTMELLRKEEKKLLILERKANRKKKNKTHLFDATASSANASRRASYQTAFSAMEACPVGCGWLNCRSCCR